MFEGVERKTSVVVKEGELGDVVTRHEAGEKDLIIIFYA